MFHEVAGRAQTPLHEKLEKYEAIHNDQEQRDEADESSRRSEEARGARECGQRRLSHGGRGELGHHVQKIDDHEQEIMQFDGETVKKMMINEILTT